MLAAMRRGTARGLTVLVAVACVVIPLGPSAAGAPGCASSPCAAVGALAVRPAAPALAGVSAANRSVTVNWRAPADGGSPITAYAVRLYKGTTVVRTVSATAAQRSLVLRELTNGTTYRVTVAARNAVGLGAPSAFSRFVTPHRTVSSPPRNVRVTPEFESLVVAWDPPADHGGSPIRSYTVRTYRGTTLVRTDAATTFGSLWMDGLGNGATYTFRVTATNDTGTSALSAASAPLVLPPAAPAAPVVTGLSRGAGTLNVTWTAPHDGGRAITGYTVRTFKGSDVVSTRTAPATATRTTVTGLSNAATYVVIVTATNALGEGVYSDGKGMVPGDSSMWHMAPQGRMPAPATPVVLSCTIAGDYNGMIIDYRVTIRWTFTGGVYDLLGTYGHGRKRHWLGEPATFTYTNYGLLEPAGSATVDVPAQKVPLNIDDPNGNQLFGFPSGLATTFPSSMCS